MKTPSPPRCIRDSNGKKGRERPVGGSPSSWIAGWYRQQLTRLLRVFFFLIYQPLARSYDYVAAFVSLGRWTNWVLSLIADLEGPRVLELGHGPGHLQVALHQAGMVVVGVDVSWQMSVLASGKLRRVGLEPLLINGYAQYLPFKTGSFDQVTATFPAEFIWEQQTLREVNRVLSPQGELILLPIAWISGRSLLERAAAWLFRITGQAPERLDQAIIERSLEAFYACGFQVHSSTRSVADSTLLIVRATKRNTL